MKGLEFRVQGLGRGAQISESRGKFRVGGLGFRLEFY